MTRNYNISEIIDIIHRVFPVAKLSLVSRIDQRCIAYRYSMKMSVAQGGKTFYGVMDLEDNISEDYVARGLIDYVVKAMLNG